MTTTWLDAELLNFDYLIELSGYIAVSLSRKSTKRAVFRNDYFQDGRDTSDVAIK